MCVRLLLPTPLFVADFGSSTLISSGCPSVEMVEDTSEASLCLTHGPLRPPLNTPHVPPKAWCFPLLILILLPSRGDLTRKFYSGLLWALSIIRIVIGKLQTGIDVRWATGKKDEDHEKKRKSLRSLHCNYSFEQQISISASRSVSSHRSCFPHQPENVLDQTTISNHSLNSSH